LNVQLSDANGKIQEVSTFLAQSQEQNGNLKAEIQTLNGTLITCEASFSQSQQ
jgi:hypothetical protein